MADHGDQTEREHARPGSAQSLPVHGCVGEERPNGQRVFGSSIPKSGTHLLSAIFENLGYRVVPCRKIAGTGFLAPEAKTAAGDIYAFGHWRYREPHITEVRENDYKMIVLIRDPRDICLSMADFFRKGQPRLYSKLDPSLQHLSQKELVKKLINGFTIQHLHISHIVRFCSGWLNWREVGAAVVRYEDLARQEPIAEVEKIGVDPCRFLAAAREHFGGAGSITLNKGIAERWRTEFDDELKEAWHKRAFGLATSFGYEEV